MYYVAGIITRNSLSNPALAIIEYYIHYKIRGRYTDPKCVPAVILLLHLRL